MEWSFHSITSSRHLSDLDMLNLFIFGNIENSAPRLACIMDGSQAQTKVKKEGTGLNACKKVQQAVLSLRANSRTLQSFAMETDDQQAQQMCNDFSRQLNQMASRLSDQIKVIESQHPVVDVPDHEYTYW